MPNASGSSRHFYWLDWMRFTAAFLVVACHARGGNWVEWGRLDSMYQTKMAYVFFALTRDGFECVIVFFALSGFLVGGKVLDRVGSDNFNAMSYAVDRISRIWMPLIPALLLTAAIGWFLGNSMSVWGFLGNLLGLQGILCGNFGGNDPLWSLSYEIWFYILAGCMAVAINPRSPNKIWAYFGVTIGVLVFTRLEAALLFCWILGALSFSQINIKKYGKATIAGCLLVIAGFVLSQLKSETGSLDKRAFMQFLPSRSVATLILSAGLALVMPALTQLRPSSSLAAAFERLGSRLVAFSYTLYLTHFPLIELWKHFIPNRHATINLPSILLFFAEIASCLLVAWILYLPFERKTTRVRAWLGDRFEINTRCR